MRVLFVPFYKGNIAHHIPLLALEKMLAETPAETAFMLRADMQPLFRSLGANVLDIPHEGFRSEMKAYAEFSPDVVVDDYNFLSTSFATQLAGVPRVTIQRTGIFPGSKPRNANHRDSGWDLDLVVKAIPALSDLGLPQPQSPSDLFDARIKIVPGIRLIELLPPPLEDDPTYVFSGPLLADDLLITQIGRSGWKDFKIGPSRDFSSLKMFLDKNRRRKIVYVTVGTLADAHGVLLDCMRWLLETGFAIISSVRLREDRAAQSESYYYAPYLPMHFVCSNADLMIHHCGSGTYHYPILHELAMITVGTMSYDRDDVAERLQELGATVHLPAPDENPEFMQAFKAAIGNYFESSGDFRRRKVESLSRLNKEVQRTASEFHFAEVLSRAIDSPR